MKQLAVAMHSYNEVHKKLPPHAVYSDDGKPLLSWRVLMLPFLEQEPLYKKFKLDEPWDSPHNLPLLAEMPPVFKPLYGQPPVNPNTTFFQVIVGPGAAFERHRQNNIPSDFPDSTGDTLLLVQAAHAVPWTKPEDLDYDPDGPLPELGLIGENIFGVAMVDASVQVINRTVSAESLRAAITRNGKDKLGNDW